MYSFILQRIFNLIKKNFVLENSNNKFNEMAWNFIIFFYKHFI